MMFIKVLKTGCRTKMAPDKILIIRFSSAGDIVLLSALIRCIRSTWPDASIDMVTRLDMRGLIEENPNLNGKYYLDRKSGTNGLLRLIAELKKNNYDLVVDAHGSFRSRVIRRAVNPSAYTVIDKKTWKRKLLINFKINLLKNRERMLAEYFEPLRDRGVVYDNRGTEVFVSESRKNKMHALLGREKIYGRPLIGIAPGASWPKKAYPMEKYSRIAMRLLNETDCGIILFGGDDDERLIVQSKYTGRVLDLQGNADFQESAFAAGRCILVLTNDSLMLHLSEAVGTDVFAVFGPTTRELGYFPYRKGSRVFEVNTWCRPCSKHGGGRCFRAQRYCLTKTDENEVFEEIKKRLEHETGNNS